MPHFSAAARAAGVPIGDVIVGFRADVTDLISELLASCRLANTAVPFEDTAAVTARLLAYARSVAHFPTGVSEFPWRNGYFWDISQAAVSEGKADPAPTHSAWLKEYAPSVVPSGMGDVQVLWWCMRRGLGSGTCPCTIAAAWAALTLRCSRLRVRLYILQSCVLHFVCADALALAMVAAPDESTGIYLARGHSAGSCVLVPECFGVVRSGSPVPILLVQTLPMNQKLRRLTIPQVFPSVSGCRSGGRGARCGRVAHSVSPSLTFTRRRGWCAPFVFFGGASTASAFESLTEPKSVTKDPAYALLFDCDGVIVLTEELHRKAYNGAFEHFNLKIKGEPVVWTVEYYDVLQVTCSCPFPRAFLSLPSAFWRVGGLPHAMDMACLWYGPGDATKAK